MKAPRFEHERTGPRWPVTTFDPQAAEMPRCPACGEDRMERTRCEHCGSRRRTWLLVTGTEQACGAKRSRAGLVACWLGRGHPGPHVGTTEADDAPWFVWPNENEKENEE